MVVQAGGVGMMRLGMAAAVLAGDAGAGEHELRMIKNKTKVEEKRLRILRLLDRLLELIERSHPGDGIDKINERVALLA